jgi:hypothetical protein
MRTPWNRNYYYIVTKINGEPYLLGPYDTERDAQSKAFEKLRGILFEVKQYPTKDLTRATRMDKYGKFEEGSPEDMGKKIRHTIREE